LIGDRGSTPTPSAPVGRTQSSGLPLKEGQGVNVLKPNQRATVYTLLERNTSGREIARITGIDRKTVRSYRSRWLAELANSPGVATG